MTDLLETIKGDTRILSDPPPRVIVVGLGDSSVNLQLRFWIKNSDDQYGFIFEYTEKSKNALERLGHEAYGILNGEFAKYKGDEYPAVLLDVRPLEYYSGKKSNEARGDHQTSQTFFVLTHLLRYSDVLWYDAGWTGWAARNELPVE